MTKSRPTIGAFLIMKNEELNLPRVLDSIKDVVDEIYITDTGSTDRSVEIAKSYGAHVSHFDWVFDFSKARNFNFSQGKTDYALWIDCDDVLSNKEEFINWRDNCMSAADYWLATYNYAFNPNTKTAECVFQRERVIKLNRGLEWKYFLHEGIPPMGSFGQAKVSRITTWCINHNRTSEDLEKDKGRNLKVFEHNKHNLDARMKYYYGKELFDNKRPVEAAHELMQALAMPELELHDRILGYQYAAYAYFMCNQFERAIDVCLQGNLVAPQRSEFYVLIADAYVKLNRPLDAIPYYNAAKSTMSSAASVNDFIFKHNAVYEDYPRNQLGRLYFQIGDLNKSKKELEEAVSLFNREESKVLLKEVNIALERTTQLSNKTSKKDHNAVIFTCPHNAYEWDGDMYRKKAMGGSETACIEMAENIKRLRPDLDVIIYNSVQTRRTINGVDYCPFPESEMYFMHAKPWLHIAWRHTFKVTDAPTFIWSHDLQTPGVENTQNYNKVMCLTPFHKSYMHATQGVPLDKIYTTKNGLNPSKFKELGEIVKDPNKVIFSSSPDRGMDRAILITREARKKFPELKLHLFYGIEHLDKYGRSDLRQHLEKMIKENSDFVVYHGATEQKELLKHMKEAAVWLYPSDWVETCAITAMEVMGCGAYPIVRKIGGVVDTIQRASNFNENMYTLDDSDCVTWPEHLHFRDLLIDALENKKWENVKVNPNELSWESVAKEWLEDLPKMF